MLHGPVIVLYTANLIGHISIKQTQQVGSFQTGSARRRSPLLVRRIYPMRIQRVGISAYSTFLSYFPFCRLAVLR
jgi:hypothetical protein